MVPYLDISGNAAANTATGAAPAPVAQSLAILWMTVLLDM